MLAGGGVAAVLGILALIGWHARIPALIQVSAHFVPMAYNTALGFVLCGMGLMLSGYYGPSRRVVGCGGLIGLLGAATLIQEAVGGARPLDSLFFRAYLLTTENQAVMAPNTGLCFLFTGLSLVLGGSLPRLRHGSTFVAVMGSIVLALSVTALFGYSLGVPAAYGWGKFAQMAVLTAFGFVFVGLGIIALAWRVAARDEAPVPNWLALLPGAALFTTALLLYQALRVDENAGVVRATKLALDATANEVALGIKGRLQPLERMAERWGLHGAPARGDWEADAGLYVRDLPDIQAAEWVDMSFQVRWIVPLSGNEAALNIQSASDERRRRALEAARDRRETTLTGFIKLVQGGTGFLAYVPIHQSGQFEGFLVGVFRAGKVFDALLQNVASQFELALAGDNETVYHRAPAGEAADPFWEQQTAVDHYGVRWHIRVRPTAQWLHDVRSAIPEVVLGGGFLVSLLVGGLVHFGQQARSRNLQIQEVNRQLESDIAERRRVEQERERLIQELRQALAQVNTLSGLLPICASCKKIRDDKGYWNRIEAYISDHSEAEFTHSICPECTQKLFPQAYEAMKEKRLL